MSLARLAGEVCLEHSWREKYVFSIVGWRSMSLALCQIIVVMCDTAGDFLPASLTTYASHFLVCAQYLLI